MSRLSNVVNAYFIEMINVTETKQALSNRLAMTMEERAEVSMPVTHNLKDAFYVVLGCRFQDSPVKSFLISIAFIVMIGMVAANFITSFLH